MNRHDTMGTTGTTGTTDTTDTTDTGGPAEAAAARTEPRHVLVTGAGSGIGRCLVERLAAAGHHAWAGARRLQDLEALAAIPGVVPLALDVTDTAQVQAAAVRIAQASGGVLHGLVNSAAIGGLGWLHGFDDAAFAAVFDTNVAGPQRLGRELLPLLLAAGAGRGCIVHVGSMGGSITSRWYGPYTASKHALEALAACQRMELAAHGVHVAIVQPGGVDTGMGGKDAAATRARFAAAAPPFDAESQAVLRQMDAPAARFDPAQPESASNRRLSTPAQVCAAIEHALFCTAPRARYLVGSRWEGDRVVQALIERWLDANEAPSQRRSRDELVALLDAALAERAARGPAGTDEPR
jgi:NAD(P)-dependent dehydrogenase (short-subunit alcohol dehydrogenase family)